jgi:hypothetical protein
LAAWVPIILDETLLPFLRNPGPNNYFDSSIMSSPMHLSNHNLYVLFDWHVNRTRSQLADLLALMATLQRQCWLLCAVLWTEPWLPQCDGLMQPAGMFDVSQLETSRNQSSCYLLKVMNYVNHHECTEA